MGGGQPIQLYVGLCIKPNPQAVYSGLAAGRPASTEASVNELALLFGLQLISKSKWCFLGANLKNKCRKKFYAVISVLNMWANVSVWLAKIKL